MILPLLVAGGILTALVFLKDKVTTEKAPPTPPPIPPDPNVKNFFVQKGKSYLVTLKYKAGYGANTTDKNIIALIANNLGFEKVEVPTPQPGQEPCVFTAKFIGDDRYLGTNEGVLNVTEVYPIA